MRGAVAGGSPLTVQAGLEILEAGGNAVDAAIAATCMAGVAEPVLTGLGGAGMAMIRYGGETVVCDMFANVPGLGNPDKAPLSMETVRIDFGPTTQGFLVGPAAAAVPGIPAGLTAMHDRYGTLPLSVLVAPAMRAAVSGVPVTVGFERVCSLLWPILDRSPDVSRLLGRNGQPLQQGATYRCPQLADTLDGFAREGDAYFRHGAGMRAILDHLGEGSKLNPKDFEHQTAIFRPALQTGYRDARIWVPGPPSIAGLSVMHTLMSFENLGEPSEATGRDTVFKMETALTSTSKLRGTEFFRDVFTDGYGDAFRARVQAGRTSKKIQPGYTTHISTVDQDGNAVAMTHSLGETCGEVVPSAGILINNFLGEEDVNPPSLGRPAGSRLMTMCCPTLVETSQGQVFAMGSGGSGRIPSAVLHGAMYIVDHGFTAEEAVRAPRTHVENGRLHVETEGRSHTVIASIESERPDLVRFDGPNMFFGGLHVASVTKGHFTGAGDRRRSGEFGSN